MAYKSLALFYNKALVKTPPKTTKELLALAKKLTVRKKNQYGLAYQATDFYYHAPWFHGFGARVFKGKTLTIASKASAQALAFARDLKVVHKLLPAEPTSHLITSLFNQGKAAVVINGPWFRGEIDKKVNYGVAPLPIVSQTKQPAAPFLTSEAVLLSRYSKHKRKAFEVMTYLTSKASALIRMNVGQQPVANVACYQTAKAKKDVVLQAFYKQMKQAIPMPNTPEMRVIWTPILNALGKTFRQQATPAKALAAAHREAMVYIKRLQK
jgi:arabinogalactan oligomer/maltooligosaccharide transport system substrate-binding protein